MYWPGRRKHRAVFLLAVAALAMPAAAEAIGPEACGLPPPPIGEFLLAQLTREPYRAIATFPNGGGGLRGAIAWLAANDSGFTPRLGGQLGYISVEHRLAIGEGLWDAVQACGQSDASVAARINAAVTQFSDTQVLKGFRKGAAEDAANDAAEAAALRAIRSSSQRQSGQNGSLYVGMPPPEHSGSPLDLPDPFGPPEYWR